MEEKKYNITYKTTSSSGRYYIGRHSTDNINDGYQGSGKWVKECKNNGKVLITEPLNFYNTFDELLIAEQELLDTHIIDPMCMNYNNRSSGFAVGNRNPANSEKERKRRSEESWTKTEVGRQWMSENNPSKKDDVKVKRSICLKEQWNNQEYRDLHSGDNHHMKTEEHRDRMKNDNHMFKDVAKKKSSENCFVQLKEGTHNFQNIKNREKALKNNPIMNGINPMHNPEVAKKISIIAKNRPRVECPHCKGKFTIQNATKYHFEKCKQNNLLMGSM
jgi:hypothetical protein